MTQNDGAGLCRPQQIRKRSAPFHLASDATMPSHACAGHRRLVSEAC